MQTCPSLIFKCLAYLMLLSSAPVIAHVHGAALLQLAISEESDGVDVTAELRATGADMVGFEHPPATVDEKRLVADTRARLGRSDWLRWPAANGCVLVKSTTTNDQDAGSEVEHDEPDVDHDEEGTHGDWVNRSHWRCRSIPTRLATRLSELSPTLVSLDVHYVTPKGQGSAQLTQVDSLLSLDPSN